MRLKIDLNFLTKKKKLTQKKKVTKYDGREEKKNFFPVFGHILNFNEKKFYLEFMLEIINN